MRARLIMAVAAAGLGFGFSQPAAAGVVRRLLRGQRLRPPSRLRSGSLPAHLPCAHARPAPHQRRPSLRRRLLRARLRLSVLGSISPRATAGTGAAATGDRGRRPSSPLTPIRRFARGSASRGRRPTRRQRGGCRTRDAIAMTKTITRALLALTIVLGLNAGLTRPAEAGRDGRFATGLAVGTVLGLGIAGAYAGPRYYAPAYYGPGCYPGPRQCGWAGAQLLAQSLRRDRLRRRRVALLASDHLRLTQGAVRPRPSRRAAARCRRWQPRSTR